MKLKFNYLFKKKNIVQESNIKSFPSDNINSQDNTQYQIGAVIANNIISGGRMIENIRNSLINELEQFKEEQKRIYQLSKDFSHEIKKIDKFQKDIRYLREYNGLFCEDVYKLKDILLSIDECIFSIKKTSQHTNLIAINAAIESAHVGRLGRGFATISQEIRTLSSEIQNNIAKITKSNIEIEKTIGGYIESSEKQSELINEIVCGFDRIREAMNILFRGLSKVNLLTSIICEVQFLNVIKIDHILWKLSVYDAIMNKKECLNIPSHNSCRFGKWYYGNRDNIRYTSIPYFLEIESPHKKLHDAGVLAIEEYSHGDFEKMKRGLDEMESYSLITIEKINSMISYLISEISNFKIES
ncbi:TPA: methyl-accepting chemotaxis protein [Escherichia coli]